jgi:hypothetical protein
MKPLEVAYELLSVCPTALHVVAVGQAMALRLNAPGDTACVAHVDPPSVVEIASGAGSRARASQVVVLGHAMYLMPLSPGGGVWRVHVVPPSTVPTNAMAREDCPEATQDAELEHAMLSKLVMPAGTV